MNTDLSKLAVVSRFFSGTGASYDRVVVVCTCGLDRYWKKRMMALIPDNPSRIMDQACGTGIVTFDLARRFPGCRVTGVELRDEYLAVAREKAQALGVLNVEFLLGRAEEVLGGGYGYYDCITSSYLAKYAELEPLIANARLMLRPGGVVVMHDFTYPSIPFCRLLWRLYFRLMSMVCNRVYPEWRTVFQELPEFLRQSRWLPETLVLLDKNGFCDVCSQSLFFGAAAIVSARTPPSRP